MTTNQMERLELVRKAYVTAKRGEEDIYILNTDILDTATQNALLDIQHRLEIDFNLSYQVMGTACDLFSEADEEIGGLEGMDFSEMARESASVYTYPRLQYMDANNQSDITEIMREYSCSIDIADACAIWYDRKVTQACEAIRSYILNA